MTLRRLCSNFSYLPTISRPQSEAIKWSGHSGYLQDLWRSRALAAEWGFEPSPETTDIFICGNPAMVDDMVEILSAEGYVEHNRRQFVRAFERFTVLEQDAKFRAFAGADHDSGRGGKTHRARAGNHQHRDKYTKGKGELCFSYKIPGQTGQQRYNHYCRDKVETYPVRQVGYGRLGSLGLTHHPDYTRQYCILTDAFCQDPQHAVLVQGSPDNLVPFFLGNRETLTRQHGFIHA